MGHSAPKVLNAAGGLLVVARLEKLDGGVVGGLLLRLNHDLLAVDLNFARLELAEALVDAGVELARAALFLTDRIRELLDLTGEKAVLVLQVVETRSQTKSVRS